MPNEFGSQQMPNHFHPSWCPVQRGMGDCLENTVAAIVSFLRKQESMNAFFVNPLWIPACAGMTGGVVGVSCPSYNAAVFHPSWCRWQPAWLIPK